METFIFMRACWNRYVLKKKLGFCKYYLNCGYFKGQRERNKARLTFKCLIKDKRK